jgi:hypothetical protein
MYSHGPGNLGNAIVNKEVMVTQHIDINCLVGMLTHVGGPLGVFKVQWNIFSRYGREAWLWRGDAS